MGMKHAGAGSSSNLNKSDIVSTNLGVSPKAHKSKMNKIGKIISNYKESDTNKKYKTVRRIPTASSVGSAANHRSRRRIIQDSNPRRNQPLNQTEMQHEVPGLNDSQANENPLIDSMEMYGSAPIRHIHRPSFTTEELVPSGD